VSLLLGVLGLVLGLALGAGGLVAAAPMHDGLATFLLKTGLNAGDGWIAEQQGNEYELHAVEYDADTGAYVTADEGDSDRRFFEDPDGLMHQLFGTPFGFTFDDSTAVTDAVTSAGAKAYGDLAADGGRLDPGESIPVEDLKDKAHIGTLERSYDGLKHRIEFINPFAELPAGGTIVDARQVQSLLSQAGSPDTPQKAAENAAQAERAFEDWGELKRNISLLAAAMVGGLLVYIGMSGGGGGSGGGGISLMLSGVGVLL